MSKCRSILTKPAVSSVRRTIRVKKEDSAFVYCILESHEGITAYSTLGSDVHSHYRDLDLQIPPDFVGEVEEVLHQLGDMVYELESSQRS